MQNSKKKLFKPDLTDFNAFFLCFMAFLAHFHAQFFLAGHFFCSMKTTFRKAANYSNLTKSTNNLVKSMTAFILESNHQISLKSSGLPDDLTLNKIGHIYRLSKIEISYTMLFFDCQVILIIGHLSDDRL